MIKRNKNKMKGFTLVELLAVIVILAIILVIAVPKVMSVIEDSKKATLESTAKMIASTAEKAKVQNTLLGKETQITCESVAKINKLDYEDCDIEFDDNTAKVTIKGSGKFAGLYVCNGTKTEADVTKGVCALTCDEREAYVKKISITKPYAIKDYDACIDYVGSIILSWGTQEGLMRICRNKSIVVYSFEDLVSDLILYTSFTEEELISNNILDSSSVWEANITVGDYSSCVSYLSSELLNYDVSQDIIEENIPILCNGDPIFGMSFSENIEQFIYMGFTKEELLENKVVGSNSFPNIKPGNQTTCVNELEDIVVNSWGYSESELQTLCNGDALTINPLDDFISSKYVSEYDLVENNVIEGTIEEEKVCVPDYTDGDTYITKLLAHEETLHNGLVQTYATINGKQVDAGIRYVGPLLGEGEVKNQVYFNCEDEYTSDSKTIKYGDEDYVYKDHCEVWRIIGVFNTKSSASDANGTPRIKIVREELVREKYTTNMSWDSSSKGTGTENNSGYGINQWGDIKDSNGNTIYEGADLMRVLNGYYIGESSTCTYCNSSNQGTCPTSNNCASIIGQISSTSLKMVDDALWYTGATAHAETLPLSTMYAGERSTQNGKICTTGDYCTDNVTRTTTWVGKVGLIYPSDYAYASADKNCASDIQGSNSTCNTNNWLHKSGSDYWTITPRALPSSANGAWYVQYMYSSLENANISNKYGVRPALYLASDVKIVGGDGTEGNAYILSIN